MRRELLMRAEENETTVAVIEDGRLVELYIEHEADVRFVGNIYKGVVKNILPGMQAAFVDIGLEKNAFLYVDDASAQTRPGANDTVPRTLPDATGDAPRTRPNIADARKPGIQSILKEGQDLLVQIIKEPAGSKGARITTQVTLPGRYLVLMPSTNYCAISQRVQNPLERERLQALVEEIKPGDMGLIARTIGEGASREELIQDLRQLKLVWEGITARFQNPASKGLIYRDLGLCQRILRDVFSAGISRLMVNSRALYNEVLEYLDIIDPDLKRKVFVCNMEEVFEKYAIEQEIAAALDRRVWLKSGGYLIFDKTEALTVIDVNTGKYVGSIDLADTILRTNIEAAAEIARQLRIRNIGGIIIIDFIDMTSRNHKQKVLDILTAELGKDSVKTHVMGFTALNLIEITRKKVGQSLDSFKKSIASNNME